MAGLFALLALALALAAGPAAAELGPDLDAYAAGANALMGAAGEGADADAVAAGARALIERADRIAVAFAVLYPSCGPYLGAGLGLRERLEDISLPELERDYHAGAALPEAGGFCYHALDLVVHPAAVVVLVRNGDVPTARLAAELSEALANLGAVRRLAALAERPPRPATAAPPREGAAR